MFPVTANPVVLARTPLASRYCGWSSLSKPVRAPCAVTPVPGGGTGCHADPLKLRNWPVAGAVEASGCPCSAVTVNAGYVPETSPLAVGRAAPGIDVGVQFV